MKKREFDILTIILMSLLATRGFFTIITGVFSTDMFPILFSVLFGSVYLAAFFGVYKKRTWGAGLVIGFAVLDLLILQRRSEMFLEVFGIGFVILSLIINGSLVYLGYREYEQLSEKPKRKQKKKKKK